jgi:hypothetical protein
LLIPSLSALIPILSALKMTLSEYLTSGKDTAVLVTI